VKKARGRQNQTGAADTRKKGEGNLPQKENQMDTNGDIKSNRVNEIINYLNSEISKLTDDINRAKEYNCITAEKYFDGRKDAYEHMIAVLKCDRVYN
jgi:predicted AlkP superfamily phosphohydrolase/phosphomutase